MIYRRRTYRVRPEQVEPFTAFFLEYLLPNQLKHGAELIGRWLNQERTEITAVWAYESCL
jgi:8-oxo-dGTP diphosphatase